MKKIVVITLLLVHWFYLSTRPAPIHGAIAETQPAPSSDPYQLIDEANGQLKEGDLVVRLNTDPASQFIRSFNRKDKKYSHAGVVMFEKGVPYVYHIVNGEDNPGGKMRKDLLRQFCDPRKNLSFGVFRYDLKNGELKKLRKIVHEWYAGGIRFDGRFDLSSDRKMYCSEMVSKAVSKATAGRIVFAPVALTSLEARVFSAYSRLSSDYVKKMKVMAIDELYSQKCCRCVKECRY